MNLKDILAISGYPGLFRYISQAKNGIIVESLIDKKRMPAYASAKVSALEDIAIFTESAEVPLGDIFSKIFEKESGGPAPAAKSSPEVLMKYFMEILPDFDKSRVYASDIKKVFSWYNILHGLDLLNLPEEEKKEEENKETTEKPAEKAETAKKEKAKPAKKPAAGTKK
ncbi:MAG: DUF5606 domain-containing protein [Bacteroidales bacterium]|nr:DUF5606 domain-containing protein [Bacteroidales bacterium]MCB9012867.1 DUF5606 domain-containing protein [Bacteroidales bacterium]